MSSFPILTKLINQSTDVSPAVVLPRLFATFDWSKSQVIRARITPEFAAKILKTHNVNNRRMRESTVRFLMDQVAHETFDPDNGDCLRFDTNGELQDGQHRLEMIVRSNRTFNLWVKLGNKPSAYQTIDRGSPKNVSDDFRHMGETDSTALAAICHMVSEWDKGVRSQKMFKGKQDAFVSATTLEQHPAIRDAVRAASSYKKRPLRVIPRVIGFTWLMTHAKDHELAESFFHKLFEGQGLYAGDPVLALRNKLMRSGDSEIQAKLAKCDRSFIQLLYIAITWNHCRNKTRLTKLQLTFNTVGDKSVLMNCPEFK